MKSPSDTITVREAADILGLSVQHVHRLIESGALTVERQLPGATGAKLIPRTEVDALRVVRSGGRWTDQGEYLDRES